MNPLPYTFSLLLLLFSFGRTDAQQAVLQLNMDKTPNGGLLDESRNSFSPIFHGNLDHSENRFGHNCRALSFDGASYISIPDDPSLNFSSAFSLTAWVKIPRHNNPAQLKWLTLVCKGESAMENNISPSYRIQLTNKTASINTPSTKAIGEIRLDISENTWIHVGIVYDGQNLSIYQDGSLSAQYYYAYGFYQNTESLNIGRDVPGLTEYFIGSMDDLRLFDFALDKLQIKSIYKDNSDQNLGDACTSANQPPGITGIKKSPTLQNSSAPGNNPDFTKINRGQTQPSAPSPPQGSPTLGTQQNPRGKVPDFGVITKRPEQPIASNTPNKSEASKDPKPSSRPPAKKQEPKVEPSKPQPPTQSVPDNSPYSFKGIAKNNLTLLLDVSGSMNHVNKLPLLKEALRKLVQHMRAEDRISIVTFSGAPKVILDGVSAKDIQTIETAIMNLNSAGKTKGKPALKKAQKLAKTNYLKNGNNRIILATDGNFSLNSIEPIVADIRNEAIYFSIFSFGKIGSDYKKKLMDQYTHETGGQHTNITKNNVDQALLEEVKAIKSP